MDNRIVAAALGAARAILVLVAVVVATIPIGLSAVTSFCPEDSEGAEADGAVVGGPVVDGAAVDGAVVVAAGRGTALATIIDPSDTQNAPSGDGGTQGTGDGGTDAPADGPTGGATDPAVEESVCGAGVSQCFPPLISSVVTLGDGPCAEEAGARLRARLVPAFIVSAGLLVGAWVLRPRHGGGVFSRY